MRVWVDCTAAAHPLVLRPIVERLREQRSRGRDHDARVRPDGRNPRAPGPRAHGRGAPRRRLDGAQGLGARRPQRATHPLGAPEAVRSRGRPRVGRPGGRLQDAPHPLGPDAGLRARGAPAKARVESGPPRPGARRDSRRGDGRGRRRRGEARALPGPQGGLLPRGLRAVAPRPVGPRACPSSASRRTGWTTACSSWSARRPRRPSTTPRTTSTRACSTASQPRRPRSPS